MDIPDYLKPQLEFLDQKIGEANALLKDPSMADLAQDEITRLEAEKKMLLDSVSNINHADKKYVPIAIIQQAIHQTKKHHK
jgi:hypothetical protein